MIKKISAVLSVILIVTTVGIFSNPLLMRSYATVIPEYLNIGIYYNNPNIENTTVSSPGGLNVGLSIAGVFTALFSLSENQTAVAYKDTYHIAIGLNYATYADAKAVCTSLAGSGVTAFPAFRNTWRVCSGTYTGNDLALAAIQGIKDKLGASTVCSVLAPDGNSVKIIDNTGKILLISSVKVRFNINDESKAPYILVNGTEYRGGMLISNTADILLVVNQVAFDDYLASVVPSEIGGWSPDEAIKAQAVTARTYALNRILVDRSHSADGFDLCTTVHCQAYKGYSREIDSCTALVRETTGEIVTYNGEPAKVFYFSTSGGYTENCENVWFETLPYLKGVPDPYESRTAQFANWTVELSAATLKAYTDNEIGDILSMEIISVSASGRALEVKLTGTAGVRSYFKERCRTFFGLRSQLYTVTPVGGSTLVFARSTANENNAISLQGIKLISSSGVSTLDTHLSNVSILGAGGNTASAEVNSVPTKYVINGKGWGHGVGMSQMGAIGMADAGISYTDIIKHYFTGVDITKLN